MKIALVHYWLVGMRGGERVLEALCDLYPEADIYTHVYLPEAVSQSISSHKITTTFIGRLPFASTLYKRYLPLMPLALEELDMSAYDLVISSKSGPAKGVIAHPDAVHVCYCHSPMRYIWNLYHRYRSEAGIPTRLMLPALAHYLRSWDQLSAARVDAFVANSWNVARQIERCYDRTASVVYPPVDTDYFCFEPKTFREDFYLVVGELVRYKRPDLAVEACTKLDKRLVVIGGGEMLSELRRLAGPTVEIIGPQPIDVLRSFYRRAKALIFPGEEDFGIVPVEAMASGCPVIAFRKGGACETVVEAETGCFFAWQTVEALAAAMGEFEAMQLDPRRIAGRARAFGEARFKAEMTEAVTAAFEAKSRERQGSSLAKSDLRRTPAQAQHDLVEHSLPVAHAG